MIGGVLVSYQLIGLSAFHHGCKDRLKILPLGLSYLPKNVSEVPILLLGLPRSLSDEIIDGDQLHVLNGPHLRYPVGNLRSGKDLELSESLRVRFDYVGIVSMHECVVEIVV